MQTTAELDQSGAEESGAAVEKATPAGEVGQSSEKPPEWNLTTDGQTSQVLLAVREGGGISIDLDLLAVALWHAGLA